MKLEELPKTIPIFPLSNFIMFPGTTVPLNIFEPRYLQMVNDRISLGLPIDISVAEDFQSSTKHLNYLYGKAIDGIYEFFRLDSNINNSISKPVFKVLNNNYIFKKYSNILSDKGLNL